MKTGSIGGLYFWKRMHSKFLNGQAERQDLPACVLQVSLAILTQEGKGLSRNSFIMLLLPCHSSLSFKESTGAAVPVFLKTLCHPSWSWCYLVWTPKSRFLYTVNKVPSQEDEKMMNYLRL